MLHSSLRKTIRTKSAFNYVCVSNNSECRLEKSFKYSPNIKLFKVSSRNTSSNYQGNIYSSLTSFWCFYC